jgi:predicted dehydrogenase
MVHFIDVALWLNPSPPVRVFAEGSARGNFTLLIRFQDGSLTTIQHTLGGHFDYPKELYEISANHVTLALDHHIELRQRGLIGEPFRTTYPFRYDPDLPEVDGIDAFHQAVTDTFEQARKSGRPPAYISPDKGLTAHLDRFLDCIERKGENPCSVTDAVVVTRIALKLLQSIRLGTPLPIEPEDWHVPEV